MELCNVFNNLKYTNLFFDNITSVILNNIWHTMTIIILLDNCFA